MAPTLPATLDSAALSRRLGELAGHERAIQVEFLLHLLEFDRRLAYREEGYDSLWSFCTRALHLREGAAGRRIAAMRVLQRIPSLADVLRDGRLCLSTLAHLGPVLTADNAAEIVARAAYRTRAEVEVLVASLRPRTAPADGVRRVTGRAVVAAPLLPLSTLPSPSISPAPSVTPSPAPPRPPSSSPSTSPLPCPRRETPPTVRAVAAETYSLRVTVDAAFKADLDQLTALVSHKVPDGNLASVLREALRCAIETHGKRRGAVAPKRKVASRGAATTAASGGKVVRPSIPAAVRREVWNRDAGRCTWVSPDGRRCGSDRLLEFEHVHPVALGGKSTISNLTLRCRAHNVLEAERMFGGDHMARFRRPRTLQLQEVAAAREDGASAGPP